MVSDQFRLKPIRNRPISAETSNLDSQHLEQRLIRCWWPSWTSKKSNNLPKAWISFQNNKRDKKEHLNLKLGFIALIFQQLFMLTRTSLRNAWCSFFRMHHRYHERYSLTHHKIINQKRTTFVIFNLILKIHKTWVSSQGFEGFSVNEEISEKRIALVDHHKMCFKKPHFTHPSLLWWPVITYMINCFKEPTMIYIYHDFS